MSFLRTFFLTEVFRTLAFLLGAMQALVLHWLWVVALGNPVPPDQPDTDGFPATHRAIRPTSCCRRP